MNSKLEQLKKRRDERQAMLARIDREVQEAEDACAAAMDIPEALDSAIDALEKLARRRAVFADSVQSLTSELDAASQEAQREHAADVARKREAIQDAAQKRVAEIRDERLALYDQLWASAERLMRSICTPDERLLELAHQDADLAAQVNSRCAIDTGAGNAHTRDTITETLRRRHNADAQELARRLQFKPRWLLPEVF